MPRLVVASNNPGKLRELEAMLRPLGFDPVAQSALGVGEAEEPHETFLENALAKARHACVATGLPALADDSGLAVPGLAGEPGVHSAYYAGTDGARATRRPRLRLRPVLRPAWRRAGRRRDGSLREEPREPPGARARGAGGEAARAGLTCASKGCRRCRSTCTFRGA